MKKICLSFIVMLALGAVAPLQAMEIYQTKDELLLYPTSCQDVARIAQLFGDDDTQEQSGAKTEKENDGTNGPRTFHEQEFSVAQAKLTAYVREVNWKTGFNLTLRDANWFERLKVVCTGVVNYSKPFRVQLDSIDPDIDEHLEEAADQAIDALKQTVTNATFHKAAKLTLHGLGNAMITNKPFLLLLIDEDTYDNLVKEPNSQIEELADNMYQFFAYRAAYMGEDYNKNTPHLLGVARLGKGDAINTWANMNQFATKMYQLEKENKLTPETEKSIHIWKLNAIFQRIKRKVDVEKKAAKMAAKKPENKTWIKEQSKANPKRLSKKQAARQLLQRSTEKEIKALMDKYLTK